MEPLRVIEVEIGAEMGPRLGDPPIIMKVDFLVFDGSPETFDEDVVIDPAATIHADANACLFEDMVVSPRPIRSKRPRILEWVNT